MPLYEYRCESCGHTFEVIRRFSDPPIETCPVCGGPVQKLLSAPAIQFKGSGWYITDYPKKSSPEARSNGSSSSSSPPDSASSESKTSSSGSDSTTGTSSTGTTSSTSKTKTE